jgi:hydrogenase small subunit
MGCKGPSATYNCPNVRWNDGTSWPVEAGHNCIGCAAPEFWASMSPFYERLPNVPGFGADTTAETIGLAVVGGTAALMAAHGAGKAVQARVARGRAPAQPAAPPGPEPRSSSSEAPGAGGEPAPQPPEEGGSGGEDQD